MINKENSINKNSTTFWNGNLSIIKTTTAALVFSWLTACSQIKCQTNRNDVQNAWSIACNVYENTSRIKNPDWTQEKNIKNVKPVVNIQWPKANKDTWEKPLVEKKWVSAAIVWSQVTQKGQLNGNIIQWQTQFRVWWVISDRDWSINDSTTLWKLLWFSWSTALREKWTWATLKRLWLQLLTIEWENWEISSRLSVVYDKATKILNPNADKESSRRNKKIWE